MFKIRIITAAITLAILGCSAPRKSAWRIVKDVPKLQERSENRDAAYISALQKVLTSHAIEHQTVTFEYPWETRYNGIRTIQRTAIIYRDASSPKHPWWLMDFTLQTPIWLPNGSMEGQLSFYVRQPVTLLEDRVPTVKAVIPLQKKSNPRPPVRKYPRTKIQPPDPTSPAKPAPSIKPLKQEPAKKEPQTSIQPPTGHPAQKAEPNKIPTAKPELIDKNPDQNADPLSDPEPVEASGKILR